MQLIECASTYQLWAETYDRDLGEASVFDIQDDLTHRIVATVADAQGVLSRSISAVAANRPLEELSPYQTLLRAFAYALGIAKSINMPGFLMTHVCRAITHTEMGDEALAKTEVEALLELVPDFAESADVLLGQFLWGDLKQRVVEGLRKAGFDI